MTAPLRVLVCDDSAVMRGAIARALESDPQVRVVARAADGAQALAEIARHPADVVVLDVEMPVMDGLEALPRLLRAAPGVRVVMASTLTTRGGEVTLRALRLGAADYVAKPSAIVADAAEAFRRELIAKVKALGGRAHRTEPVAPAPAPRLAPAPAATPRLLAIGASTGGPQALLALVGDLAAGLPAGFPVPVVITQHMPAAFTPLFAAHLGRAGALPCAEAREGEALLPGRIYLAPGDKHLLILRENGPPFVRLTQSPPVNYCRPSVDPMLHSASEAYEGRVLVAILTGMGHDGLEGTRRVVEAGGAAVAQDEASSVVWGMPGAIVRAGLCHAVLPLPMIAPKLRALLRGARA